jgi:hypothetical protein
MPRKPKLPTINAPQRHSAWPHLFGNVHLADKLTHSPEFELLLKDIAQHRSVNAEFLIHLDETKEPGNGMKTRGIIWLADLLLALPEAVENWKKQQTSQ